jgi:exodeoxyribonuclease-3
MFRILTLNANGIRSADRKGFFRWLARAEPDIVCLQEVKAHEADIRGLSRPARMHGHLLAERKDTGPRSTRSGNRVDRMASAPLSSTPRAATSKRFAS